MDEDQKYMRYAIEAALEAERQGGVAIGAILVNKSGQMIAKGGSLVAVNCDPTSHAEINCIRTACQHLHGYNLVDGYTVYSTLEPCHMCLSAIAWAKIENVVFGAYRKDVDASLFDITGKFSDEREAARMNLRESIHMNCRGGVLEKDCASLLQKYGKQSSP